MKLRISLLMDVEGGDLEKVQAMRRQIEADGTDSQTTKISLSGPDDPNWRAFLGILAQLGALKERAAASSNPKEAHRETHGAREADDAGTSSECARETDRAAVVTGPRDRRAARQTRQRKSGRSK
jgi:hypothetical protein